VRHPTTTNGGHVSQNAAAKPRVNLIRKGSLMD
jgi:hypothetical protein